MCSFWDRILPSCWCSQFTLPFPGKLSDSQSWGDRCLDPGCSGGGVYLQQWEEQVCSQGSEDTGEGSVVVSGDSWVKKTRKCLNVMIDSGRLAGSD